MNKYKITQSKNLKGRIRCNGAKNFAIKAMVASILGKSKTTLYNVPNIGDIQITLELLTSVGIIVNWDKVNNKIEIDPTTITSAFIKQSYSGANRIPVLLLGALLNIYDEVSVPVLGGCQIGYRKLDFHLEAIERFGGTVEETPEGFVAKKVNPLVGVHYTLPYPSVGATESCLFLSVLAKGRSVISNIAIEPEIMALITMLRGMGAIIYMSENREIIVYGVDELKGTEMHILGDRMEAASWASLAVASDSNIVVEGVNPMYLNNFLSAYRQIGGGYKFLEDESIEFFRESKVLKPIHIETDVYPGFSTDWQQPFAIALTQAKGTSIIHETVYENRFGYLEDMKKLGANVEIVDHCLGVVPCRFKNKMHKHSAIIVGNTELTSSNSPLRIPDLRAGLAYIVAAIISKGESIIEGVDTIERGYGDIIPKLRNLGVKIGKID